MSPGNRAIDKILAEYHRTYGTECADPAPSQDTNADLDGLLDKWSSARVELPRTVSSSLTALLPPLRHRGGEWLVGKPNVPCCGS